MSGTPAVSIIVAAFNHARFARPLVRSSRQQTFANFEVVLVDDGSTDGTLEAWKRLAGDDPRFRFYDQPNAGVVAARNRGVELARAPLVTIVDSDDLLPCRRTQRLVDALAAQPDAPLAWGDAWIVGANNRPTGRFHASYPPPVRGDFSSELFATWCFVPAQSVMFRRDAWLRTGPFWGPGENTDYLKWIELGLLGSPVRVPGAPVGAWRQHGANASAPPLHKRIAQYHALADGLGQLVRRNPRLAMRLDHQRIAARLARCHFMAGFHAGCEGAWPRARAEFAAAWRLHPNALHVAAWCSTLPGLATLAAPVFRLAARRWLHV